MTISIHNNHLTLLSLVCLISLSLPIALADSSSVSAPVPRLRGGFRYSYVYMTARNKLTNATRTSCVNYQQYKLKTTPASLIAETFDQAEAFILKFWQGDANRTKICPLPDEARGGGAQWLANEIVPLDYRIDDDGTACTRQFSQSQTSFRNATQFTVDTLQRHHAEAALLIVDKGRQFVQNWKDYLFSNFHDPTLRDDSLPTFYIYRTDLYQNIMSIMNISEIEDDEIEFRFHRPADKYFDMSLVIIWFIAMTCVTGGGLWAFHRHSEGKDIALVAAKADEEPASADAEKKFLEKHGNVISIIVMMFALCAVLLVGYIWRDASVMLFNLLLVVFGTASIYGCIRALFSNFSFTDQPDGWYNAKIEFIQPVFGRTEKFSYTSFITFSVSFAFCVFWFVNRRHAYAFIALDIINMALCLHVLKCLRLPSLKWISLLMGCMFVYDAFMVFGTPYFTGNGCSIMLQVATGIDGCSGKEDAGTQPGYPVPPVEKPDQTPEKFPMLMQVPHMNVMNECLDLDVELAYQTAILGLGDIVMPGYLIAHCFTMNGFTRNVRLLYGLISIIGYGCGLVLTFVALALSSAAQPALIYLVPLTLLPIMILALVRREFLKIWNGCPPEEVILINEEDVQHPAAAVMDSIDDNVNVSNGSQSFSNPNMSDDRTTANPPPPLVDPNFNPLTSTSAV